MNRKCRSVDISIIQMGWKPEKREENVSRAVDFIDEAAEQGANVAVLPYLFNGTQLDLPEPIPGYTTKILSAKAKERGIYVVGSFCEKADACNYSTMIIIDPKGKLLGKQRKTHITPLEYGKISAGNNFEVIKTPLGRWGFLICYDLFFPEVARILALKGAEILICSGNARVSGIELFRSFAISRAYENQAYGVLVNPVGPLGLPPYLKPFLPGRSLVASPEGILAEGQEFKQQVFTVSLDLGDIRKIRKGWPTGKDFEDWRKGKRLVSLPVLVERRPELYDNILTNYNSG